MKGVIVFLALLVAVMPARQQTGASPAQVSGSGSGGMTSPAATIPITVQLPAQNGNKAMTVTVYVPVAQLTACLPSYADGEVPIGSRNGTNVNFKVAHAPLNYPQVFLNGLLMKRGTDYTITGAALTFINKVVPDPQSTLMVWYRY